MMCDTSLTHTANEPEDDAQRPADDAPGRLRTSLTSGNEETAKVIGKT